MTHVAVIGAGAMGLAAAYQAAKDGHQVSVFEADTVPGGMAAHFDFDGLSIERFCHFATRADEPLLELMRELGIGERMGWRSASMGTFTRGRLHPWGDARSLLRFPHLDALSKLRYGLLALSSVKRGSWAALDELSARAWVTRWCGRKTYDRLWKPLLELKFHEHAATVSAAWLWTRIRRMGRARWTGPPERFGAIEGGSETLVRALLDAIAARGGTIRLGAPVAEVLVAKGGAAGMRLADGAVVAASHVISTVPTSLVSRMIPALPEDWRQRYDAVVNIGVACVVLKLARSATRHFWVNVAEPGLEIPGFIEFSHLRPMAGASVVYVPCYMPTSHPKWRWDDAALAEQAFEAVRTVNPALRRDDLLAAHVGRLKHAQPVCPPGFAATLPPIQTPIDGLQVADTCFYYPEDRGLSESIRLGRDMARAVSGGPPAVGLPPALRDGSGRGPLTPRRAGRRR